MREVFFNRTVKEKDFPLAKGKTQKGSGKKEIIQQIYYGRHNVTDIFNRRELKNRRQILRRQMTTAEKVLWSSIRREQIKGARFRRQVSIGSYVVDFYCPKLKLVIEIDGCIHEFQDVKEYDRFRESCIKELGITIIRFSNEDIFERFDDVIFEIHKTVSMIVADSGNLTPCGPPS